MNGKDSGRNPVLPPEHHIPDGEAHVMPDGRLYVYDSTKSALTAADFKTAMSGVQLVYELATPLVYDLTPQTVQTLAGTNNIWSSTGNSTIKIVSQPSEPVRILV